MPNFDSERQSSGAQDCTHTRRFGSRDLAAQNICIIYERMQMCLDETVSTCAATKSNNTK
eukprot:SAG31_NODE_3589_length_4093_cov_2.991487_4_plen_60_part_00